MQLEHRIAVAAPPEAIFCIYESVKNSQAVCQAEVFAIANNQEILCAIAQGTIASIGQAK